MMKLLSFFRLIIVIMMMSLYASACSSDSVNSIEDDKMDNPVGEEDEKEVTPKTTYDITNILEKLTAEASVSYEIKGAYVYIYATGVPNHKSPYFEGTEWHNDKYEDNNTTGFRLNPNRIQEKEYEFRIPLKPTVAANKSTTPMGPMGVAINGVPLFNQYAAGGVALTREFMSFDQYAGHPSGNGSYHYHIEPTYITDTKGSNALVGVLLDGFPVYGPEENGEILSSDDLDEYHGHFGVTEDFPEGIYHYHVSADAPYINGDGFYGEPGTVSN